MAQGSPGSLPARPDLGAQLPRGGVSLARWPCSARGSWMGRLGPPSVSRKPQGLKSVELQVESGPAGPGQGRARAKRQEAASRAGCDAPGFSSTLGLLGLERAGVDTAASGDGVSSCEPARAGMSGAGRQRRGEGPGQRSLGLGGRDSGLGAPQSRGGCILAWQRHRSLLPAPPMSASPSRSAHGGRERRGNPFPCPAFARPRHSLYQHLPPFPAPRPPRRRQHPLF